MDLHVLCISHGNTVPIWRRCCNILLYFTFACQKENKEIKIYKENKMKNKKGYKKMNMRKMTKI